jgi:predicted methyltransferase
MSSESPRLASASGGLPSAVGWAHLLLADRLRPGARVVDATAGNGHDTLFLARLVGPTGHVLAFDVQAEALAATRARLDAAGIDSACCTLVQAGHETLAEHLPADWRGRLDAAVFNLGYLPGGDKTRITRAETTLAALAVAAAELAPGGLLTIAVYPGHEGGREEQRTMAAWAESLPARAFEVQLLRPINRAAAPPECWAVLKKG